MVWLLLVLLGIFSGTIAGLLGIGGGILVVPGLAFIFQMLHLPQDNIMHFAIGTSLAIMIFTASSAVIARHRRGEVDWKVFTQACVGIIIGTVVGAYCDSLLSSNWLYVIYGIFLLLICIRMFIGFSPLFEAEHLPKWYVFFLGGLIIGFKSGVLGVGGGTLSVPFLCFCGLPIFRAFGTSSLFSLLIAIIGSISFAAFGWVHTNVSWSTGFIYWPAFLCVAPFGVIFAPLGAKASGYIAQKVLQKIFAILLLIIALKMFWI